MKIRMFPSRNLGCVGVYSEAWAVDFFRTPFLGMYVRLGMRTWRFHLEALVEWSWLRWVLLPPLVMIAVWFYAVALMGLGG